MTPFIAQPAGDTSLKLDLQESEYYLPYHWLYKKGALAVQQRKLGLLASMVRRLGAKGPALDLGCGDGKHTADLQVLLPDCQFQGIDFSERAITFAQLLAPHIPFSVQQAKQTKFPDASFELLVSIEVIEHIEPAGVQLFLTEIHRLLKPNGTVVITTPTTNRPVDDKHFQHFTENSLRKALEQANFQVKEVQGFGLHLPGWLRHIYQYLISLPVLWRLQPMVQGRVGPAANSTCILISAKKSD